MDGVLLLNKPNGLTSHDVVARARKIFGTKKVGHAGTLDPFATGLLVLCLGKATRIVEYLTGCDKTYTATMRLGQSTDTQDLTGQVLTTRPVPEFSSVELNKVFAGFVGSIEQTPPMYSAKRVAGTRLYTLARQGKIVERAARPVRIHALELHDVTLPDIRFRVSCSSGTYIRTLAHDIGECLGCGAHLTTLQRTHIGGFSLDDAVSLEYLGELAEPAKLCSILHPLDSALAFFPSVTLNETLTQKILHGIRLEFPAATGFDAESTGCRLTECPQHDQLCRIYSENSLFLGLAQWMKSQTDDTGLWVLQPRKVLVDPDLTEKP